MCSQPRPAFASPDAHSSGETHPETREERNLDIERVQNRQVSARRLAKQWSGEVAVVEQTTVMQIGDAEVRRVVEWVGPLLPVKDLFPDTPARVWTNRSNGLAPHHFDRGRSLYRAAIQTWVVRQGGKTVLVDTGVGNDRERPQIPTLSHLRTPFLDRLAEAGVDPSDVDVVVNTHIHYDHVGWNTRWIYDAWKPCFPNATYLVPRADYEYFHPDNSGQMREARTREEEQRFAGIRLVFADSIAPIEAAGQLKTWQSGYDIGSALHLVPTPGHTPGSSLLWLDRGPGAAFVGDLLHSPVQILRPDDACAFDLDADRARESRRAVLTRFAGTGAYVLPTHLAGHGGGTVSNAKGERGGQRGFEVTQWADLPEL